MPTATHFALLAVVLLAVTFVLALLTLVRPGRMHLAFSLLVALVALGAMGSFEFVREAIRKPYVIANYLYANSLYVHADAGRRRIQRRRSGRRRHSAIREMDRHPRPDRRQPGRGRPRNIPRGVPELPHGERLSRDQHYLTLRQWDQNKIQAMLGGLEFMHNGVMPPFCRHRLPSAARWRPI